MRRLAILLPLLLLGAMVVFIWRMPDPGGPRFVRGPVALPGAPMQALHYQFMDPRPFEGGQVWLTLMWSNGVYRTVLFDVQARQVLGELKGPPDPSVYDPERERVLCSGRRSWDSTLKGRFRAWLARVSVGRVPATGTAEDVEMVWLLDLKTGRSRRVGSLKQWQGAGSSWVASPSYRYAYNKPTSMLQKPGLLLCDLQQGELRLLPVDGWPQGWLNDENFVVKGATGFQLYAASDGSTHGWLSMDAVERALKEVGVVPNQNQPSLFSVWTGESNQFYLADTHQRWLASTSYLFRVTGAEPRLELVSTNFQFGWSDRFDPTQRYYVYSGREPGQASSAVFLRDLETGAERTLVPDDGLQRFSLPHFYGGGVIYSRSNELWRTDLSGTNHVRLWPPG